MLRGEEVSDIHALRRQRPSIPQISALSGFHRRTMRKYLNQPGVPPYGPRPPPPSKLDPFKAFVQERLQAGVWHAVVLLGERRERGYTGGYTVLKAYVHPLRQAAKSQAVRRFETPAGLQAPMEWGPVGTVQINEHRARLSGFVMTLGHSRAMFCDGATHQRLPTFLRMHEEAFEPLGTVPAELLYARCKTVMLGMDERAEILWHPIFQDFARYFGFVARLCRAYPPQTKDKSLP